LEINKCPETYGVTLPRIVQERESRQLVERSHGST
jgi:hypothetical protein